MWESRSPRFLLGEIWGMKRLKDAGVLVEVLKEGMQDRILKVAMAGHGVEST